MITRAGRPRPGARARAGSHVGGVRAWRALAELDDHHAGQDERAADELQRARELIEQQPREANRRDDLEQRHERGKPRAEPPARRDAGRVGERRGDHAEADERQPPRDSLPGIRRRGGRRAHRQDADDAEHSQADRAHREAAARQGERRHAGARIGGHDEVRRGAEHRRERPRHAVQGQVGARQQIQDEYEPYGGDARARERQRAGTLPVAQPQPHDDGGRRGVLDQQRRADVHRRDGREERELRAGHRHRAVQQDAAHVAAQQTQRARRARAASGATTSAAMAIRASTTAPGLQPISMSPRARDPDRPNDTAETSARSSPPRTATPALLSFAIVAMANDNRSFGVSCQRVVRP